MAGFRQAKRGSGPLSYVIDDCICEPVINCVVAIQDYCWLDGIEPGNLFNISNETRRLLLMGFFDFTVTEWLSTEY
jgi:hypothetical protein